MILLHFSWEWQQRAYLRCWPLSGLIDWATRAAGDLNGNFLDKLCLAFQVEVNEAPLATASTLARAPIRDTSNPSAPYQAVGTILLLSHFQQLSPFYVPLTFFFFFCCCHCCCLVRLFSCLRIHSFPPSVIQCWTGPAIQTDFHAALLSVPILPGPKGGWTAFTGLIALAPQMGRLKYGSWSGPSIALVTPHRLHRLFLFQK